ncbi:MAG TPA: ABC transporter permease [Chthonomonadaceae bacterium]|nr:ABC transporter permease [Chthonomonadaceae bacterium]
MSFLTVARKDLKVLFRDRSALIFIFGLPLIFTGVFGFIFGHGDSQPSAKLKILVVNQDSGPQGQALIEAIRKLGMNVATEPGGATALREHVKNGDDAVGIVIPSDFSTRVSEVVQAQVDKQSTQTYHLPVLMDPAQAQVTPIAQGAIYGALGKVLGPLIAKAHGAPDSAAAAEPSPAVVLDVSSPEVAAKPTAGDLLIPGYAVYFVFFMANGVAATLLLERNDGTLRRMLSAPVARWEILFGKLLARGLLGLIQTAMLFAIGVYMLHMNLGSNPFGLVLTAVASIFAATGMGLLIATMGKTMEQIQGMTTMVLLLMGLISGSLVPRQFLPEALQKFSLITPHAWALNAYQDLILRHLPLTHTLVNIGMVLVFGIVFFGLALTRFQFE